MKNKLVFRFFAVYVLSMIWLSGCKTKKTTIEKVDTVKNDTLIIKSESVVSPPILSSLTIEEVCDTVTGNPKDFQQVFVIEGDTLELSIRNNQLKLYNNRLQRTISQKDSVLKVEYDRYRELKSSETIIYRTPFKIWVIMILMVLIIVGLIYWIIKR